jgi:hypothetical protein
MYGHTQTEPRPSKKCDKRCLDGYCVLTNSSACRKDDYALKARPKAKEEQ